MATANKMSLLTALTWLTLLPSVISNTGQQRLACQEEAPDNCDFHNTTLCAWTKDAGLTFRGGRDLDFNVALDDYASSGRLSSRAACPTNGQTHCLQFDYWFDRPSQPYAALSVSLRTADQAELVLWEVRSGPGERSAARVPIRLHAPFRVVFQWHRYDTSSFTESTVHVDSVQYERLAKTSCVLQPPEATPPSTTTSTTSTTTTTTTTVPTTVPHTPDMLATTIAVNGSTGQGDTSGKTLGWIFIPVLGGLTILCIIVGTSYAVISNRLMRYKGKPFTVQRPSRAIDQFMWR